MAPKYTVTYFNIRARGELLRLLFHTAGVQFTDKRVEFADWPALKPNTPFGTLPYMQIDDKVFGESLPLARYIARKYNLMGKTDLHQLEHDIILNQIDDIRNMVSTARNSTELTADQKKAMEGKAMTQLLPALLMRMEKLLSENKSGFLIGDTIGISDLAFFDLVETPLKKVPNMLDKFPKIRDHRKKIETYPRLTKYLASRPDTEI